MPTLITLGAASAKAYGLTALTSLGGPYFIAYYGNPPSSPSSVQSQAIHYSPTGEILISADSVTTIGSSPNYVRMTKAGVPSSMYYYWAGSALGGGSPASVREDASGNIYYAGSSVHSGGTNSGFVIKANSSGTTQWANGISSNPLAFISGMTVDSSGNVYISGAKYVGDYSTQVSQVVKFNSSGTVLWSKAFNYDGSSLIGYGLDIDSSGNVYTLGDRGGEFAHVVKFNSSGTVQWNKSLKVTISGTAYTESRGIGVDGAANVYIFGSTYKSSGFQPGYYPYIAKYNTSGTIQWVYTANIAFAGISRGCVDSLGNSYLITTAGSTSPKTSYIIKFNSAGTLQFVRTLNITSTTTDNGINLNSIAADNKDNIYISGQINVGSSGYAALYMRLPSDGSKTGTYTVGSATIAYAASNTSNTTGSYTDTSVTASIQGSVSLSGDLGPTNTSGTPYSSSKTVL